MSPGTVIPHPLHVDVAVRVISITSAEDHALGCKRVLARELGAAKLFVRWVVNENGKRCGGVTSGPWASSFGCLESDGLQ